MKIAVIGDIHGNNTAWEAVYNDITAQAIDEIICLGDNIGYGPEPAQVVAGLRERGIASIMGNHEFAMINSRYCQRLNPTARRSLEINIDLLSPEGMAYLAGLPPVLLCHGARFVHGCPPHSMVAYLFNPRYRMVLHLFRAFAEKICFYGHTHALDLFEFDGERCGRRRVAAGCYPLRAGCRYLINPGSVGQPRDGVDNKAKYLIWDTVAETITFRSVSYRLEDTIAKIKALGLPDANWQRLL